MMMHGLTNFKLCITLLKLNALTGILS